jgi:hypothetical protein
VLLRDRQRFQGGVRSGDLFGHFLNTGGNGRKLADSRPADLELGGQ